MDYTTLNDEIIRYAKELKEDGRTYFDICKMIEQLYDITINPESLRYHITRKEKPKFTKRQKLNHSGLEKVLVISDLHIPYQREDILQIVEKHKNEITTLVLAGDVIDCKSISKFKSLDRGTLKQEMIVAHQLLKQIQDITPNVKKICIKGNHEARFEKFMAENKSELNELHSANILKEICDGRMKTTDFSKGQTTYYEELNYTILDDWYVQIHDAIICHPLSFSKVPSKVAYMAVEYFTRNNFEFNVCFVAHTHHIGACKNLGKLSWEIGCLCREQNYAKSGKLTFVPQDYGYHLVTFKDGVYSPNQSRNYFLD